ncbi:MULTISPECIES: hypothetical protein [unclassified Leucobacter]|uniref:hypothetical protein n=1 Tax=unclassified Leucobacter TaxID=2621730 RepID=UPI00301911AA
MSITRDAGDDLIVQIAKLQQSLRDHPFPALQVEEVTDDGETYTAIRCPRCDSLVDADDLYAVDTCDRQSPAESLDTDWALQHRRATFGAHDLGTFGETLYYLHDTHPVSLPDGWDEDWT